MKRLNDQSLKDSIGQYLIHHGLKDKANEFRLLSKWEKIVGVFIGKNTIELKMKQGKLFVRVDSSTIKHQLMISREEIIQKVNQEMGEHFINEIVLL